LLIGGCDTACYYFHVVSSWWTVHQKLLALTPMLCYQPRIKVKTYKTIEPQTVLDGARIVEQRRDNEPA